MISNYIANFISILNYSIITKRNYCKIIYTKLGERLISLLFKHGYITYYRFISNINKKYIYIFLKNQSMLNSIFQLKLISKSRSRIYWSFKRLWKEYTSANSITRYILSTSKGIIISSSAIDYNIGGEILFRLN
jgi:ribosomal protein S8